MGEAPRAWRRRLDSLRLVRQMGHSLRGRRTCILKLPSLTAAPECLCGGDQSPAGALRAAELARTTQRRNLTIDWPLTARPGVCPSDPQGHPQSMCPLVRRHPQQRITASPHLGPLPLDYEPPEGQSPHWRSVSWTGPSAHPTHCQCSVRAQDLRAP